MMFIAEGNWEVWKWSLQQLQVYIDVGSLSLELNHAAYHSYPCVCIYVEMLLHIYNAVYSLWYSRVIKIASVI